MYLLIFIYILIDWYVFSAMSMMSDSQDATDFSSTQFNISEDSNSEPPFKKKLVEW